VVPQGCLRRTDRGRRARPGVDWLERLLREEADAKRLDLPADVHEVAYVLEQLIESYVYLDQIAGQEPEARRAEPILRMLLR
jgi:hypothetical protein